MSERITAIYTTTGVNYFLSGKVCGVFITDIVRSDFHICGDPYPCFSVRDGDGNQLAYVDYRMPHIVEFDEHC